MGGKKNEFLPLGMLRYAAVHPVCCCYTERNDGKEGVDAFAGVSCTSGLANLIIGFASGMTAGLAIPLAQAFGAEDQKKC